MQQRTVEHLLNQGNGLLLHLTFFGQITVAMPLYVIGTVIGTGFINNSRKELKETLSS